MRLDKVEWGWNIGEMNHENIKAILASNPSISDEVKNQVDKLLSLEANQMKQIKSLNRWEELNNTSYTSDEIKILWEDIHRKLIQQISFQKWYNPGLSVIWWANIVHEPAPGLDYYDHRKDKNGQYQAAYWIWDNPDDL